MAKRIYAINRPDDECKHEAGFPYRARFGMPCTGPRICRLCGLTLEEANAELNESEDD